MTNLTREDRNCIYNMLQLIATESKLREALHNMGYRGEDLTRNLETTCAAFSKLRGDDVMADIKETPSLTRLTLTSLAFVVLTVVWIMVLGLALYWLETVAF